MGDRPRRLSAIRSVVVATNALRRSPCFQDGYRGDHLMTDREYARARFIGMLSSTFALAACSGGNTNIIPTKLRAASDKYSLVRRGETLTLANRNDELLRTVAPSDAPMQVFVRGVEAAARGRKRESAPDEWKPGDWITY